MILRDKTVDDIKPTDIFNAISDSKVYLHKAENIVNYSTNYQTDNCPDEYCLIKDKLSRIERFVRLVINNKGCEKAFDIQRYGNRKCFIRFTFSLGQLFYVVKQAPSFAEIREIFPNYELSPLIMLFYSELSKLVAQGVTFEQPNLLCDNGSDKFEAEYFNELVAIIRCIGRSTAFRKLQQKRYTPCKRNFDRLYDFFHALFKRFARILVIRVDFSYRKDITDTITVEMTKKHLETLLNNRRHNRIFQALVGYVWKLEYGPDRRFHYHCFFLFDGSKRQQDINICHLIGKYWEEQITGGKGTFYNCNQQHYKNRGIGMISHDDMVMRNNMLIAASYLVKLDLFFKLNLTDGNGEAIRAFGRSTIKLNEGKAKGRRRKNANSNDQPMLPAGQVQFNGQNNAVFCVMGGAA